MSKINAISKSNTESFKESSLARPLPTRFQRWLRTLLTLLLFLLVLLLLGLGTLGWYFSNQLLLVTTAVPSYTLLVISATPKTVTLQRTSTTEKPGTYGLDWPNGYAVVGDIVASTSTSVTRQLVATTKPLVGGLHVRWNINVYGSTPATILGLHYTDVAVSGPLGSMPAWFLPGKLRTWVLIIHGHAGTRQEGLRVLPVLTRLGFPVLDLSYRNDVNAPQSPDGFYHLGDTEWQDLEAGVQYALAHGAHDVVLYGWSMGGGITETFLHRSLYANHVRAVILDSPALDWHAILDLQARQRRLPSLLVTIVEKIVAVRTGIDFDMLDQVRLSHSLTAPTLLFHSAGDGLVPVSSSDAFAQARSDLVTYHRVTGVDHTQIWNSDAKAYDTTLKAFLARIMHSSAV